MYTDASLWMYLAQLKRPVLPDVDFRASLMAIRMWHIVHSMKVTSYKTCNTG